MWRARRGSPRTTSTTTDANIDCAFLEMHLFSPILDCEKSTEKIELVTKPLREQREKNSEGSGASGSGGGGKRHWTNPMDHIIDAREYDLPLHVRVSIDKQVHFMTTKIIKCYSTKEINNFYRIKTQE